MYIVLLIGSIEFTGSIYHNSKEAFSTENEVFSTKIGILKILSKN